MASNQSFDGLAFPVAKVRYGSGNYSASIYRDRDQTYRAKASYNHAVGGGARGALPVALKAFEKCLAGHNGLAAEGEYIAVPGDFNATFYTFTFVPARFFA